MKRIIELPLEYHLIFRDNIGMWSCGDDYGIYATQELAELAAEESGFEDHLQVVEFWKPKE
jgi:hypothetical protein